MKRTMIDLVFSLFLFPRSIVNTNYPDKLSRVSCPISNREGLPKSPNISKHTGDDSLIAKFFE